MFIGQGWDEKNCVFFRAGMEEKMCEEYELNGREKCVCAMEFDEKEWVKGKVYP